MNHHPKSMLDAARAALAEPTQEMLEATLVDVHEPDPEYRAMLAGEAAENYRAMIRHMPNAMLAAVLDRAGAVAVVERDAEIARLRALLADARDYVSEHAAEQRALYERYLTKQGRFEAPEQLVRDIDAVLAGQAAARPR